MNVQLPARRSLVVSRSCGFIRGAALGLAATLLAGSAQAAFHLWTIEELFTNLDGTQQFIELQAPAGTAGNGQTQVGGQQIKVVQQGTGVTHTFTIPTNIGSSSTGGHTFLIATTTLEAAGGPTPDYATLPANFLFASGGTIDFVGTNQGTVTYNALPTDGTTSEIVPGNTTQVNSPKDFNGNAGSVPEPSTWGVLGLSGMGLFFLLRRRTA